jgi:hypothetical protein
MTQPTYKEIAKNVSNDDVDLISEIANRYERLINRTRLKSESRFFLRMDLITTHGHACPLDLPGLLAASDTEFSHDVSGILRHLNRGTFVLDDEFRPRYFKRPAATSESELTAATTKGD